MQVHQLTYMNSAYMILCNMKWRALTLRACNKGWDAPYDFLLAENKVPTLQTRRSHYCKLITNCKHSC